MQENELRPVKKEYSVGESLLMTHKLTVKKVKSHKLNSTC